MNEPNISIVMPAYNASLYIRESINSVLNQTFQNYELIIIDDGSDDNTIDIIEQYQDERIHLLKSTHSYIDSLNKGVSLARGKYIARMDSDDIMHPSRLDIQYQFMENNNHIDISGTWIEAFGKRTSVMKNSSEHKAIILQAIYYTPFYHPTVIFKRELLHSFHYSNNIYELYDKNYIYAEDYKLWIQLIKKGYILGNIKEVLLLYRCTNTQITSVKYTEMMSCTKIIQEEYIEYLKDKIKLSKVDPENLLDKAISFYHNDQISLENLKNIVFKFYSKTLL